MKYLLEVKLEINQKIFVVFGDPANQVILSGKVHGISVTRKQIYYTYDNIKLIKAGKKLPKDFERTLIQCGSVDNDYIDMSNGRPTECYGMHNWPVFTSKELCINYLRRFKR